MLYYHNIYLLVFTWTNPFARLILRNFLNHERLIIFASPYEIVSAENRSASIITGTTLACSWPPTNGSSWYYRWIIHIMMNYIIYIGTIIDFFILFLKKLSDNFSMKCDHTFSYHLIVLWYTFSSRTYLLRYIFSLYKTE